MLFLVYINDLPDGLTSNTKLFAEDTFFLLVVQDISASGKELNKGLNKIINWRMNRKMSFKSKMFNRKLQTIQHPKFF